MLFLCHFNHQQKSHASKTCDLQIFFFVFFLYRLPIGHTVKFDELFFQNPRHPLLIDACLIAVQSRYFCKIITIIRHGVGFIQPSVSVSLNVIIQQIITPKSALFYVMLFYYISVYNVCIVSFYNYNQRFFIVDHKLTLLVVAIKLLELDYIILLLLY